MEWGGDREQFLIDIASEDAEGGKPPPPALLRKPDLAPQHEWLMAAWRDLINDRTIVVGYTGPISFVAIDAWARRNGISDPEEFNEFAAVIRAIDAAYLDEMRERSKDGRDA